MTILVEIRTLGKKSLSQYSKLNSINGGLFFSLLLLLFLLLVVVLLLLLLLLQSLASPVPRTIFPELERLEHADSTLHRGREGERARGGGGWGVKSSSANVLIDCSDGSFPIEALISTCVSFCRSTMPFTNRWSSLCRIGTRINATSR